MCSKHTLSASHCDHVLPRTDGVRVEIRRSQSIKARGRGRGCREVLMAGQVGPELSSWAAVRPSPPNKVSAMLCKGEHLDEQAIASPLPLVFDKASLRNPPSSLQSSCFCLFCAGFIDVCHYTWLSHRSFIEQYPRANNRHAISRHSHEVILDVSRSNPAQGPRPA